MEWVESIRAAITYIEEHITEGLTIEDISKEVAISPFYFQKGFTMLCGYTVAEYIRYRRLALAGSELLATNEKLIDIALKYGYDSPDSFTKSFTRFHGATPLAVRKKGATIKTFAPLKIKLTLEGGYTMDYKVIEKEAFTVVGVSEVFQYEEAQTEIPKLWGKFNASEDADKICRVYGINIDEQMGGDQFEYLIAGDFDKEMVVPKGMITKQIPKFTWAVFTCKGAMPEAMQETNKRIFSEWLPSCKDYEIAAGYCIEKYSDAADYPKGTRDENYVSEMWIPVKRK